MESALAACKTLAKTKTCLEQHRVATEARDERLRVGDETFAYLAAPEGNRSAREGSPDADV